MAGITPYIICDGAADGDLMEQFGLHCLVRYVPEGHAGSHSQGGMPKGAVLCAGARAESIPWRPEHVWGLAKGWLKTNNHITKTMQPADAIHAAMQHISVENCKAFIRHTEVYRE